MSQPTIKNLEPEKLSRAKSATTTTDRPVRKEAQETIGSVLLRVLQERKRT